MMNVVHFEELDSTNAYAKLNIEALADKTIISAAKQTQGHGQFQRKWMDVGSENIYMTFILKPSEEFSQKYVNFTQILAECLCEQLRELGLSSSIKLPNDVLINGKKVAGILAETVTRGNKIKGIVLGIGINLNTTLEILETIDIPATSINIELKEKINKKEFMQELIKRFFVCYDEIIVS